MNSQNMTLQVKAATELFIASLSGTRKLSFLSRVYEPYVQLQEPSVPKLLFTISAWQLDFMFFPVLQVLGPCVSFKQTCFLFTRITIVHLLMVLQFTVRWKFLCTARNLTMEVQGFGVHIHMSIELVPLVEVFFTAFIVAFVSILLVVKCGHVVLQPGTGDKSLRAALHNTLVWLLPAMSQLMSGELIAGAEAFVTVVARERFQSRVLAKVRLKLP